MNIRLILALLFCGILCSCEKEDSEDNTPDETLDTKLVIGDNNATITILDTLITPSDRCDSIVYRIDLDSNGNYDFAFYLYYCFSPGYYNSEFRFYCLHEKAKVLTNDSILSPEILDYGDTLKIDENWVSDKMIFLSASGSTNVGNDGILQISGTRYNLSNKYIGIIIENEENPIYGWIKLSTAEINWLGSLLIHETGHKKAAYDRH